MLKFRNFCRVVTLAVLVFIPVISSLYVHNMVNAQDETGDITLGVSPKLLELTANPGETLNNTFRLTNASDDSIEVKATAKNFTPLGEEGAVDLTEDKTTYAISEWTTVDPEQTTIAASQIKDFEVTIDVPKNAEPGSHFGSVVFQTIPPEQEGNVALVSQEIAPVILIKIAGDITETAEIEEFKTSKSNYSNEPTIEFISRIKNTGSAHFKPTGQIVIKNTFGNEVKKIDLEQKNVLPDSIRQITSEWNDHGFLLGRYTAELTVISGENNDIRTATTSFIVFPYQVILPVLLVIVIILFLVIKGRKRLALAAKALSGKEIDKEK